MLTTGIILFVDYFACCAAVGLLYIFKQRRVLELKILYCLTRLRELLVVGNHINLVGMRGRLGLWNVDTGGLVS